MRQDGGPQIYVGLWPHGLWCTEVQWLEQWQDNPHLVTKVGYKGLANSADCNTILMGHSYSRISLRVSWGFVGLHCSSTLPPDQSCFLLFFSHRYYTPNSVSESQLTKLINSPVFCLHTIRTHCEELTLKAVSKGSQSSCVQRTWHYSQRSWSPILIWVLLKSSP